MSYNKREYDDFISERQKRRAEKERKYRRKVKITILIILILIVAAVVVSVLIFKDKGSPYTPKNSVTTDTTDAPSTTEESTFEATSEAASKAETTTSEQINKTTASTQPKTQAANAEPVENKAYDDGISVSFNKAETSKWYLKLINPWSDPLPEDYAPELSTVQDYKVHSGIVSPLKAMISAATEDGINLYIVSGYRSYQRQKINFDARVQQYINQGMSKSEAEKKTATIIAVPGTSEHHLGLALDFNSLDQSFANTKAGQWLANNAYKYGFILRYEKDTTDITGIVYEPWHYRYVTVGHAKKIQEMGVTLEEYIDWLNSQG